MRQIDKGKDSDLPLLRLPRQDDSIIVRQAGADYRATLSQITSTNSSSSSSWSVVSTSTNLSMNSKYVVNATSTITLTLPTGALGEVEFFSIGSGVVNIDLNSSKYRSSTYSSSSQVQLQGGFTYTRIVWLDSTIGWYPIEGELEVRGSYPYSMRLWLESGNLLDKSGNNNNATPVNATSPPLRVLGLDNKLTLRWNGSPSAAGTQELQITPFMAGTTSATVYVVYTVSAASNYSIIRTGNLDDFWYFSQNNAGYPGVFRTARYEAFPLNMPSSGSHLVSIHISNTAQEWVVDKVTKGSQAATYTVGDRFRIGANNRSFVGDISLMLVYPTLYTRGSTEDNAITSAIKSFYPSLPYT